jgi:diguanylate cyclase (GGDEF)-like protein
MAKQVSLKRRLLPPLAVLMLAGALGVVLAFFYHARTTMEQEFAIKLDKTELSLQSLIDNRARKLAVALEAMEENERLLNDFLTHDRKALFEHTKPLFERLHTDYQLSHFYFYDTNRTVFLQVHHPDDFGDSVTRVTLQASMVSNKMSYGVELGPLGDLTLRVVMPWRKGDKLLGYVELGEEVTGLILNTREVFGLEIYVALDKRYLSKETWDTGNKLFGRTGSWHEGRAVAIAGQTLPSAPAAILDMLSHDGKGVTDIRLMSASGLRRFLVGIIPIRDVSERTVGKVAVLEDLTSRLASVYTQMQSVAALAAGGAIALFALFYGLIAKTQRQWHSERGQLLASQNAVARNQRRIMEDMEQGLLYDKCTSLPNRALAIDRLEQHIHAAQRERRSFAVMVIELLDFEATADTLGDDLLDQLLQQVTFRLKEGLRKSDTVARTASNQFGIILPAVELNLAVALADKVAALLRRPYSVENIHMEVHTALGISLYPYHGQDGETLLRRAETAKRAASHERSAYAVFDSRKESGRQQQLALVSDLQQAISNDDLTLNYLPRVALDSRRVNGVEALLRWRHPEQGFIPAEDIITLAEKTGLAKPLTLWILNRALRQQATWIRGGVKLPLTINVTGQSLGDADFASNLQTMMRRWEVPPSLVCVELSEPTLAADPRRLGAALEQLHALSIGISIDDVGTGPSVLTLLKALPVSEIKIHQNLIYSLPDNRNNSAFVQSAIQLAHHLGLTVTAEGVKNKAIWDTLDSMNCDMAQGYHICQPTTSGAFECWLVNSKYGLDKPGAVCAVPNKA